MQGGGVQPPEMFTDEAAMVASDLSPHILRPRRASAKRSWPPGCGQSPVQGPAAVGGNWKKGTNGGTGVLGGRAAEAFTPTTVSPPQDSSLPQQQCPEKVEEAIAPTSSSVQTLHGGICLGSPHAHWDKKQGSGMLGGRLQPPATLMDAAVMEASGPWSYMLRPRRASAKWSWSPGQSLVLASAAMGGNGEKGTDGGASILGDRAYEAFTPTTVSPPGIDGSLPQQQGSQKVETLNPATVSPIAQNGVLPLPRQQQDSNQRNVVAKATFIFCNWKLKRKRSPREGKVVAKAVVSLQRIVSDWKMKRKRSPREWKRVLQAMVGDKMKNKLEGSWQRSNRRTPLSDPIDAKTKGNGLESGNMNATMLGNAEASARDKMQSKTLSAKTKVICSNLKIKQNEFARKLKVDGIDKDNLLRSARESKLGKHVATNQTEESYMNLVPDQVILQALMTPDRWPSARGRKCTASASKSLVPRNKMKGKYTSPAELLTGQVVSRELINDETVEDNEDTNLKDDDKSKALVVYGEKREIFVAPSVPSGSHHKQHGDHIDARSKVRKLLQLYQATYRKLTQIQEQGIHKVGSIYLEAAKAVKKDPIYRKIGAIVGNIPGVEVGDEFHFRIELSIVGLHRPYQGGIDISKVNGVPIAISIVASGGYPDELSSSGELIYTGSGGEAGGNKDGGDQKLKRGNLALKNCIDTKTPVRVIHGFKGQTRSQVGKRTWTFTYDGLYEVVDCWQEGPKGGMFFRYKLQRIAGQPELTLHAVKAIRKSKIREGLCLPDISEGNERIPICVINTIDDMRLTPFKYITKVTYPTWYGNEPQKGCNCTNPCSDSIRCACAVKNDGEIPFNRDSAIVKVKHLVYECGPWCRCPSTCYNRVSQHGVKIPLEIFKTGKTGWGVRSLSSISSGSFICEYTGELLDGNEAENRQNDEYLFDIGSNYYYEELWKGFQPVVDAQSSTSSSRTMESFTIDAAKCGNVGRFINHSCSPNLYAQNVLWDHYDMRMPHVMFFAAENIPPLQELTYHYNYTVGSVHGENGNEKVKHCYCGASNCSGRLY